MAIPSLEHSNMNKGKAFDIGGTSDCFKASATHIFLISQPSLFLLL